MMVGNNCDKHSVCQEQKSTWTATCNWDAIRAIKQVMNIPVIANGGIGSLEDVLLCMKYTGCDGVMSSEGLLENPGLFSDCFHIPKNRFVTKYEVCEEYLDLAQQTFTSPGAVKGHVMKFLKEEADLVPALRKAIVAKPGLAKDVAARVLPLLQDFKESNAHRENWRRGEITMVSKEAEDAATAIAAGEEKSDGDGSEDPPAYADAIARLPAPVRERVLPRLARLTSLYSNTGLRPGTFPVGGIWYMRYRGPTSAMKQAGHVSNLSAKKIPRVRTVPNSVAAAKDASLREQLEKEYVDNIPLETATKFGWRKTSLHEAAENHAPCDKVKDVSYNVSLGGLFDAEGEEDW